MPSNCSLGVTRAERTPFARCSRSLGRAASFAVCLRHEGGGATAAAGPRPLGRPGAPTPAPNPTPVVAGGRPGWWFAAADRSWHRGTPPAGWFQAGDGRWLPPLEGWCQGQAGDGHRTPPSGAPAGTAGTPPPTPLPADAPTPVRGTQAVPDVRLPEPPLQLRQPTAAAALARPPAGQRGGGALSTSSASPTPEPVVLAEHLAAPWAGVAVAAAGASLSLTAAPLL